MGEWKSTCMHAHTQSHANSSTLVHPDPSGQTMTDFVTHWLDKKPPKQALVYDIFPLATAVFSYAIGSRKLSANKLFFVGAQTVVRLLQTTQIISDICFYNWPCCLRQLKQNQNCLNRERASFLTRDGCVSCLRACLGARLLPQSY